MHPNFVLLGFAIFAPWNATERPIARVEELSGRDRNIEPLQEV